MTVMPSLIDNAICANGRLMGLLPSTQCPRRPDPMLPQRADVLTSVPTSAETGAFFGYVNGLGATSMTT
jgi:hypothetical protein